MIQSILKLIEMLIWENIIPGDYPRIPESASMEGPDQVVAWHKLGADDGPIMAVYYFVGRALCEFVPENGIVVDLGCGTGRFAAFLARLRPDIQVIGIDLSDTMVALGNQDLERNGLSNRVKLIVGNMLDFVSLVPKNSNVIASLYALHHLPTLGDVSTLFDRMHDFQNKNASATSFVFDLARSKHKSTAMNYPIAFTPNAPKIFNEDSINSILAAYSFNEIQTLLNGKGYTSLKSRFFPLYQCFWKQGSGELRIGDQKQQQELLTYCFKQNPEARKNLNGLKLILPALS